MLFIHPAEDKNKIVAIKSESIDIFIDSDKELSDDDVQILDVEELKKKREKG